MNNIIVDLKRDIRVALQTIWKLTDFKKVLTSAAMYVIAYSSFTYILTCVAERYHLLDGTCLADEAGNIALDQNEYLCPVDGECHCKIVHGYGLNCTECIFKQDEPVFTKKRGKDDSMSLALVITVYSIMMYVSSCISSQLSVYFYILQTLSHLPMMVTVCVIFNITICYFVTGILYNIRYSYRRIMISDPRTAANGRLVTGKNLYDELFELFPKIYLNSLSHVHISFLSRIYPSITTKKLKFLSSQIEPDEEIKNGNIMHKLHRCPISVLYPCTKLEKDLKETKRNSPGLPGFLLPFRLLEGNMSKFRKDKFSKSLNVIQSDETYRMDDYFDRVFDVRMKRTFYMIEFCVSGNASENLGSKLINLIGQSCFLGDHDQDPSQQQQRNLTTPLLSRIRRQQEVEEEEEELEEILQQQQQPSVSTTVNERNPTGKEMYDQLYEIFRLFFTPVAIFQLKELYDLTIPTRNVQELCPEDSNSTSEEDQQQERHKLPLFYLRAEKVKFGVDNQIENVYYPIFYDNRETQVADVYHYSIVCRVTLPSFRFSEIFRCPVPEIWSQAQLRDGLEHLRSQHYQSLFHFRAMQCLCVKMVENCLEQLQKIHEKEEKIKDLENRPVDFFEGYKHRSEESLDLERYDDLEQLGEMRRKNCEELERIQKFFHMAQSNLMVREMEIKRLYCSICYARKFEVALVCGHVFCSKCLESLEECPVCRKVIEKEKCLKLFL